MPAQVRIVLSREERKQLEKNVRSRKTPVRLVERSKIVLLAAMIKPNYKIAEALAIDVNKVGRWRNRFADKRLPGIEKDLPRGANQGGKNSEEQAKLRSKIIKMTTQTKPKDATHWSTRGLAGVLGINHSFVNRVWREVGLKPHLTAQFKLGNDPHFEEKLRDVVGLYLSPPANAVVFCVDEKTSMQALDRTQPGLPMKRGRCGTTTHDYKRLAQAPCLLRIIHRPVRSLDSANKGIAIRNSWRFKSRGKTNAGGTGHSSYCGQLRDTQT